MADIFYKLDKHDPIDVMKKCYEKSFKTFIDIKDDNYRRIRYDISFDECIEIFKKNKTHWVFIHRNSVTYIGWKKIDDYFEVGGSTLGLNRDVFLSIYLSPEDGYEILNELKLTN